MTPTLCDMLLVLLFDTFTQACHRSRCLSFSTSFQFNLPDPLEDDMWNSFITHARRWRKSERMIAKWCLACRHYTKRLVQCTSGQDAKPCNDVSVCRTEYLGRVSP